MLNRSWEKKNWEKFSYVDTRGTRHADPYKVLVLKPIDPNKTSPTWGDIFMFLESMLEIEQWNDQHLSRPPQLPAKMEKLLTIVYRYLEGDQTIGEKQ